MWGSGFRVWGFGFAVKGLGWFGGLLFSVSGLGFRA